MRTKLKYDNSSNRILHHQILGDLPKTNMVEITCDGQKIMAREGETIAAALIASGKKCFVTRLIKKNEEVYFVPLVYVLIV